MTTRIIERIAYEEHSGFMKRRALALLLVKIK